MTIFDVFTAIENTTKMTEKKKILDSYLNNKSSTDYLKSVLEIVFNPYKNTFVNKMPKYKLNTTAYVEIEYEFKMEILQNMLNVLVAGTYRGNKALDIIKGYFETYVSDFNEARYTEMIIKNNLNIGFGFALVEYAYPGLIILNEIMKAQTFNFKKDAKRVEGWYIEPKFDGFRCTVKYIDNKWMFLSSNNKELFNIDNIEEEFNKYADINYIYEGELYAGNYKLTSKIAKSEKRHPNINQLKFYVFDCIENDVYDNKGISEQLNFRKIRIKNIFINTKYVIPVKDEIVENIESIKDVENICKRFLDAGYEGAMLKDPISRYEWKRSKSCLKLKPFMDEEFEIIDILPGEIGTKNENTCGRIVVKVPKEMNGICDTIARVGDMKDKERDDIWNNPDKYIGKFATIKFQFYTEDGSLRHPSFLRMRDKNDE